MFSNFNSPKITLGLVQGGREKEEQALRPNICLHFSNDNITPQSTVHEPALLTPNQQQYEIAHTQCKLLALFQSRKKGILVLPLVFAKDSRHFRNTNLTTMGHGTQL